MIYPDVQMRLRHVDTGLCLDSNGWGDVYLLECQTHWKGQELDWQVNQTYSKFGSLDRDRDLFLTSWPNMGVGMARADNEEMESWQQWYLGVWIP